MGQAWSYKRASLSFNDSGPIITLIMNRLLAGLLVIVLVFAGGYWYRVVESKCDIPVVYSIGEVDHRFDLSHDEVRQALSDAESLWEDATGQNLFTYEEGAAFTVNFIFDDRQEIALEEGEVRSHLDTQVEVSEHIKEEYEELVSKYRKLKRTYEKRVAAYEQSLADHNAEVEAWNQKGGAPEEVYKDLMTREANLAREQETLATTARELNVLVDSINNLGDAGNKAVQDYNADVAWYNSMFGEEREFTQGDYQGDRINIYQFDDAEELRRVLAHELGHALSLEHVAGEQSIMHSIMEGAHEGLVLSPEDRAEFARVCGAG